MELIVFLVLIALMGILMLLRVPVAYAIGLTAVAGFLIYVSGAQARYFRVGLIAQRIVAGANSFTLLAIPLFLFAGKVMNEGGVTDRIFHFAGSLVGRLKGGLGHVNVVASLIFSGMSGAAVADMAGMGVLEIKAMRDVGYDGAFSCAVTGSSAIIGPIVPPSIPMVVYSVLAGVSTGKLFLGGIIPGVLMSLLLMVMVSIISRKRGYPTGHMMTFRERIVSLIRALLPLMAPIIIVGGIWSGIFTPTEAACVGALYAIGISLIGYRSIGLWKLWKVAQETAIDSAAIILMLACASYYSAVLSLMRVPHTLADQIVMLSTNPLVILIIINIFLLLIGFFIPAMVSINIFTPILVPVITQLGIDPVFFGVIMVLNLMIGMLTPPFGIVLFTLAKVSDEPTEHVIREMWPFIGILVVALAILIAFPQLVTFIPDHL